MVPCSGETLLMAPRRTARSAGDAGTARAGSIVWLAGMRLATVAVVKWPSSTTTSSLTWRATRRLQSMPSASDDADSPTTGADRTHGRPASVAAPHAVFNQVVVLSIEPVWNARPISASGAVQPIGSIPPAACGAVESNGLPRRNGSRRHG